MKQQDLKRFDAKIDEWLAKMTLAEKIGQLNQAALPHNDEQLAQLKERIAKGEIGSIIMANSSTAGNQAQAALYIDFYDELQKIAVEKTRLGIPMILGRDVIHGHSVVYPIALASACAFNPELWKRCYRAVGEEAKAMNVHWTFSPMVDLSRDPRWGRMVEGPGEDPFLGSAFAAASVEGFQGEDLSAEDSIVACAKHYLGYGFSEGGRDYNRTEISGYTMHNYVLPAFRAAIDAGCATVMASFNDINGQPVASSHYYLTELLRDELGLEGFVVSDWGSIRQMIREGTARDLKECAEMSLPAGMDMDMDCTCFGAHLEALVKEGRVDEKDIDLAVRRILRVKMAAGLFEHPYCSRRAVDIDAHLRLAQEMASESMILVKNEKNALPLDKSKNVVIGGPMVDERRSMIGAWALDSQEKYITTFHEAMDEACAANGTQCIYADTTPVYEKTLETAIKSRNADTIVLALGEDYRVSGEARCLCRVEIAQEQVELAKRAKLSGKKVVGVVFCGRPLALEAIEPYLDAILIAWHSGSRTANAAADILFGDVNPSGKASVTFIRDTGHIPLYYNATVGSKPAVINPYYGAAPGYLDAFATPMYPFGYGLSYTKFAFSDLTVKNDAVSLEDLKNGAEYEITVKVKNVGDRAGKETVQLYIHDIIATYVRPHRELKGFDKQYYEVGEEKEITFRLGADKLGFYNEQGKYLLERGNIEVFVGDDCYADNKIVIRIV